MESYVLRINLYHTPLLDTWLFQISFFFNLKMTAWVSVLHCVKLTQESPKQRLHKAQLFVLRKVPVAILTKALRWEVKLPFLHWANRRDNWSREWALHRGHTHLKLQHMGFYAFNSVQAAGTDQLESLKPNSHVPRQDTPSFAIIQKKPMCFSLEIRMVVPPNFWSSILSLKDGW